MLKRMILWLAIALAVIVILGDKPVRAGKPSPPPEPVKTHTLRWLGQYGTVFQSWGYGVNKFGDVVVHAYWYTDDQGGWIGEAFICRNASTASTMVNLNEVIDVPYADAYLYDAYDINDSGQIIGVLSWHGT
jgi:hypothetical protein